MKLATLPAPRSSRWWTAQLLASGVVAGLLAWSASAALAQHAVPPPGQSYGTEQGDEASDPPGRVGRVAELQGQVWLFNPESGEWASAERNRVLTTGDRVATDNGARAELRIGSTTVRLDGSSEVEFERLDDSRIDLRLHDGSLALRLRDREQLRETAVLTGEGRFSFNRTGRYRVDRAGDASHLTVLSGEGLYEGPRSALTVNANQRAEFWIDSAGVAQYAITDPQRDAFAAWNGEQDRADDRSASTRYVSPEMTGVEELDRHGRWQQNEEYGALWVPYTVAPGWAPYRSGRWAWVRPWGWTWVDEAPWGFAPFHYGRWVWLGGHWAWSPGAYARRPVFAPALVAWVGGANWSLSINAGGGPAVGWVPLAPREVYVPGYRYSPRYVRNVNITHVTNVTIIEQAIRRRPGDPYDLRNRKFPHAVTVVPAEVVTNRRPVLPVARQWQDDPKVREIVARPARETATFAAPVAPPVIAPRSAVETSTVKAPPRAGATRTTTSSERPQADERPVVRPDRGDRPVREPREGRGEPDRRGDRGERGDRSDRGDRPAPALRADRPEREGVVPRPQVAEPAPAVRPPVPPRAEPVARPRPAPQARDDDAPVQRPAPPRRPDEATQRPQAPVSNARPERQERQERPERPEPRQLREPPRVQGQPAARVREPAETNVRRDKPRDVREEREARADRKGRDDDPRQR